MMNEQEKPTTDRIDSIESMLEALDAVPEQIKDDSEIETFTEDEVKAKSD